MQHYNPQQPAYCTLIVPGALEYVSPHYSVKIIEVNLDFKRSFRHQTFCFKMRLISDVFCCAKTKASKTDSQVSVSHTIQISCCPIIKNVL